MTKERNGRYSLMVNAKIITGDFYHPYYGAYLDQKITLKETNILEKIDIMTSVFADEESLLKFLYEHGKIEQPSGMIYLLNEVDHKERSVVYQNPDLRFIAKTIVKRRMEDHRKGTKTVTSGLFGRKLKKADLGVPEVNRLIGSVLRTMQFPGAFDQLVSSDYFPHYRSDTSKIYKDACIGMERDFSQYIQLNQLSMKTPEEEAKRFLLAGQVRNYFLNYSLTRGFSLWEQHSRKMQAIIQEKQELKQAREQLEPILISITPIELVPLEGYEKIKKA